MKDFPSCFGENGIQVVDFPSSNYATKVAQNLVTCIYQCKFHGKYYLISITWSKNLMGQGLSVGIDNCSNKTLYKMDIKSWLFSKKKGSKRLESNAFKIEVYWDLSSAKFGSGPEPLEGFYVGIVFEKQMVLFLGDMKKEAFNRTGLMMAPLGTIFVSKRERIFGKKVFGTKAQFSDVSRTRNLVVECDTSTGADPSLVILFDGKQVMQVKRLRWKFRGNHVVLVDGVAVEVFWDVHDWLFGGSSSGNTAVFMFRTREPAEKLWRGYDPRALQWSWSQRFQDVQLESAGFSLILYAWKNE